MAEPTELKIGMTLPGEALLMKMLDVYEKSRANMSEQNRNDWDRLIYVAAKGWHNWWISIGWPGEKV